MNIRLHSVVNHIRCLFLQAGRTERRLFPSSGSLSVLWTIDVQRFDTHQTLETEERWEYLTQGNTITIRSQIPLWRFCLKVSIDFFFFLSGWEKMLSCFLLWCLCSSLWVQYNNPEGYLFLVFTNVSAVVALLCSFHWLIICFCSTAKLTYDSKWKSNSLQCCLWLKYINDDSLNPTLIDEFYEFKVGKLQR